MTTDITTADTAGPGLFDGLTPCHAYTRADALFDGVLVDVCDPARRVGFTAHSAFTAGLYEALGGGDDDPGTVARVEETLRRVIRAFLDADDPREDRVWFTAEGPRGKVDAWAAFGPADDPDVPVLTVMLSTED